MFNPTNLQDSTPSSLCTLQLGYEEGPIIREPSPAVRLNQSQISRIDSNIIYPKRMAISQARSLEDGRAGMNHHRDLQFAGLGMERINDAIIGLETFIGGIRLAL